MRRLHLVELEDLPWFPTVLRDAGTAYLRFAAEKMGHARAIQPVIEAALTESGETQILDLCSGGGGPVISIARALHDAGYKIKLLLTDLFPSENAIELAKDVNDATGLDVSFHPKPVDATEVPLSRPGLRTLFNGFHHMQPSLAIRVLRNAVEHQQPIAIVEVLQRKPVILLGLLLAPIAPMLVVPFLRPLRPAWLLFTYVIPLIPFFIMWDGLVSCMRVYTEEELLAMTREADPGGSFNWKITEIPMLPSPIPGLALVGIPRH